ncbi:hypothetical protein [Salibacterium halotolerans]|uniref:Uncharacterized protein n=1 Tax=Salibacterium halotolerans TaxID=1884432 RepID=A0A1I5MKR2_9BACI|nr:hypothetical protein [Salibacterium halotolerans]SFP10184.1 hypothetical protein SAMN05518683_102270 [Salibacterium halotolerans]
MAHNFKPAGEETKICRTCYHFSLHAGVFSFCLVQEYDVYEGDSCDMHTESAWIGRKREKELTQYVDTIFDRGDGKANF